ncbi:MAG: alpha/beta hydrolase, partial [Bacteroidia bacterium]|nr:alpha/beta hydrolase [Bacteroidia bacterium]
PPLNAAALADMIENLLWERKKVHCSMIGYSQGGRIVMGLIHRLPHRLQEVFILAPDGLQPNKIRNWVSRTRSGRGIAKLFVKNAALLQGTIRMLARFGFISEKIKQFYLHQSASEKDRFRIYHTWLCLRNYETHPHLMDHYCRTRNIRTAFIMGKYDTIIPVKLAERFLQTMQHKADLHILDCGHKLLQSRSSIARIILDKNPEKPVERNG